MENYFQSLPSNKDANKNLGSFSTNSIFTLETNSSAKIKGTFIKDTNSIILAKLPRSSTLTIYHSIINIDASFSKPTNKYVGLLGIGPDVTSVISNKTSIFTILEELCPSILNNISDSTNVADTNISLSRPYE